ncbi:MAG: hypothetical protein K2O32_09310 [Acetatifactor sp.]|nr:hypothetical protein [Acetatifactor sp.]
MAIGAISGNYMNPYSLPARTGRGKSLGNDAIKNRVNSGYEVVQYPTTYIYCHQACKEFDTSLDGNQCQFGIYYEDGSALDIYKSPGYTNEMPLVDIYMRNPDGEWSKETINAKEIDLTNCSFAEMRAAMVYLKESGVITDNWTYVELSRANENDPDVSYEDIFAPQNWVERVARWMQYQIEGGEYAAYKRFACLYTAFTDYMAHD